MDLSPVTYMNPRDLLSRVSSSCDSWGVGCVQGCENAAWCDEPAHFPEKFSLLMDAKLSECSEGFISSLLNEGAKNPVCIQVSPYNSDLWKFGNGHHRMAVYLEYGLQNLPVIFSFDGDYMHSDVSGDGDGYADDEEW